VDQDVEFFEKRELELDIFEEEQSLYALLLLIKFQSKEDLEALSNLFLPKLFYSAFQ